MCEEVLHPGWEWDTLPLSSLHILATSVNKLSHRERNTQAGPVHINQHNPNNIYSTPKISGKLKVKTLLNPAKLQIHLFRPDKLSDLLMFLSDVIVLGLLCAYVQFSLSVRRVRATVIKIDDEISQVSKYDCLTSA